MYLFNLFLTLLFSEILHNELLKVMSITNFKISRILILFGATILIMRYFIRGLYD